MQRQVPNPDHYEDAAPLHNGVAPVGAVALELWTVDQGYMFDNVLITRDPGAAEEARERLWKPRHAAEVGGYRSGPLSHQSAIPNAHVTLLTLSSIVRRTLTFIWRITQVRHRTAVAPICQRAEAAEKHTVV